MPMKDDHEQQDHEREHGTIAAELAWIKAQLGKMVTRDEFLPVRLIAFGLAAAVLLAVLGAVVAQVVHK